MIYFLWKLNRITNIGGITPHPDDSGLTDLTISVCDYGHIGKTENPDYLKTIKEFNPVIITENIAKGLPLINLTQLSVFTGPIPLPGEITMRDLTVEELGWKKEAVDWVNKEVARSRIEREVADDRDLLADVSKRLDVIERGLVRLLAHVLGGTQMTTEYQANYLNYAETLIALVDNLQYVPRADLEDEQALISKLIERQNTIASIVKTEYLDKK